VCVISGERPPRYVCVCVCVENIYVCVYLPHTFEDKLKLCMCVCVRICLEYVNVENMRIC